MTRLAALCVCLAVLAACGSPESSPSSDGSSNGTFDGDYQGTGLVMDTGDGKPELCLGPIMESYPPQCSGVPLADWNWDAVENEETSGQVTWGEYEVAGHCYGDTLTVTQTGPPRRSRSDDDSSESACGEHAP